MRILHVYKDFDPAGGGGVARHIHGLAVALAARGHSITVAAPNARLTSGAPYQVLDLRSVSLQRAIGSTDVVHLHGARVPLTLKSAALASLLRKPFVYTPHCYYDTGSFPKRSAKRLWDIVAETYLLRRSACTVLLTEHWQDYLTARGLRPRRAEIIPNCILAAEVRSKTAMVNPARPLAGAPSILSVGRLDSIKRIDDLIRVLSRDALCGAVLHVVGKGPDEQRLRTIADQVGVAGRVLFHGFVPDGEMVAMFAAADLFALPSQMEGLPTVLLEAAFMKLPFACSRIPGNMAICDELSVTSTHDVGDLAGIEAAILLAAAQPQTDRVARRAAEMFSWESRVLEIEDVYGAAT